MTKSLSDMTNEELWRLFPIIISHHDLNWKKKFEIEKLLLEESIVKENIERISHIGSTAVKNLLAKPTIDILLEVKENISNDKLIEAVKSIGYYFSPQPKNPAPHMMFIKGYTTEGFKGQVFHVHVRYHADWDELYFRDYLILHEDVAKEYGQLKLDLQKKFKHDRDGYTYAKTDFIRNFTKLAREELKEKYAIKKNNGEKD